MDPVVPLQNAMDVDNEADENQVAGRFFSRFDEAGRRCRMHHQILHDIFKCYETPQLLEPTLVNTVWGEEAQIWKGFWINMIPTLAPECWRHHNELIRSVRINLLELQHRGVVIDRKYIMANMFDPKNESLTEIDDFVKKLVNMSSTPRPLPLCGIYIKFVADSCHLPDSQLDELRSMDHRGPQSTCLTVHLGRDWYQHQVCPGFVLLTEILRSDEWNILELSLLVTSEWKRFRRDALQKCTLKHLEFLVFRDVDSYTTSAAYTNFIKKIVRRTPNLQILCTKGRVDLNVNLLEGLPEGSQAVHSTCYPYSPSLDEIPENAIDSLQMTTMELLGVAEDLSLEKFERITKKIIQDSHSLCSMTIDLPFLVPLMSYEISSTDMSTLRIVWNMDFCYDSENQGAWNVIKSFDFNRIFPNLKLVTIEADWESHLRQKQVLNAFSSVLGRMQGNVAPDRAVNIKGLNLEWDLGAELTEPDVKYLVQMFPNVRELSIEAKRLLYFGEISLNLDSVFCGIYPEEVAELRKMDDKYLKAVNIVPVMPSFASLKNLKRLKIHLKAICNWVPLDADNPMFLFSKVTPLIAFRNIVYVTISVRGEDIRALKHLEPYVHVSLFEHYRNPIM